LRGGLGFGAGLGFELKVSGPVARRFHSRGLETAFAYLRFSFVILGARMTISHSTGVVYSLISLFSFGLKKEKQIVTFH
jgi:hypothetical protein